MSENTKIEVSGNSVNIEQRENFVMSAIDFLQSLIEYQGRDVAMEVWEEMFERMPIIKDVKHEVLLKMLTGDIRKIAMHLPAKTKADGTYSKINAIKALREATGLGLKEAKDVMDKVDSDGKTIIDIPDRAKRAVFIRNLQSAGYTAK